MDYQLGYALGSFVVVLMDIRIMAVALAAVAVFPKPYVSIPVGALLGAFILFFSQMKMAPILDIPDPGAAKFILNAINAGLVTSILAIVRYFMFRERMKGQK